MAHRSDRRREIERLFALRDAEGLTYRELSEHSGIPFGTISWWAHRRRREASDGDAFVAAGELDLDDQAAGPDARVLHPSGLVIELRGEIARAIVTDLLHHAL